MNQFITKKDYFGLADGTMLVCASSEEGKSNEVAEATGQDGSIIAHNVYGEKIAPSNEYVMKAVTLTKAEGDIALGGVYKPFESDTGATAAEKKISVCLNSLSINTSAGAAPTVSASGEQVEDESTGVCKYSLPAFSVTKKHHAQVLFDAFNTSDYGTGVHLKSASYTMSGNITKGEKEGVCLTHDITEGKIECAVEFVSVNGTIPTLTSGDGWVITSVLTSSNPDADWPTYSATLTKYLAKDAD